MSSNTFRKQWIAALRSGKYQQCHSVLDTGKACCAFGVACRLMADKLKVSINTNGLVAYDYSVRNPPIAVIDALGLKEYGYIMEANDTGFTFEEIANLVEANTP